MVTEPVSANLSFLQNKEDTPPPTKTEPETSLTEPLSEPEAEIQQEVSEVEQGEAASSSGTSSKENQIPNIVRQETPGAPLIPLSSMSKYDIPFLNTLLCQKGIPEPPKSKPPKLPKSVDSKLPMPKISHNSSSVKTEPPALAAIKVSPAKEETEVHVTVSKPRDTTVEARVEKKEAEKERLSEREKGKGLKEAKEWYWDYEESCWKECDPDEEYEWEYIDDDDNEQEKIAEGEEILQATVKLGEKSRSQQNISDTAKELRNSADSVSKRDRKGVDLPRDEGKGTF